MELNYVVKEGENSKMMADEETANLPKRSGSSKRKIEHEKKNNMTDEQCNVIIDFMKSHSKFAAGYSMGCDPQRTKNSLLATLTKLVCEKGPAKTDKQVSDCWKYMKRMAKKYNAEKRKCNDKTGNQTEKPFIIIDKYEKVLEIIGIRHGCGLELLKEDGFQFDKSKIEPITAIEGDNEEPVKTINIKPVLISTRKRKMASSTVVSPKCKPTSTVVSPKCKPTSTVVSPKCKPTSTVVSPKCKPTSTVVSPKCKPTSTVVSPMCKPTSTDISHAIDAQIEDTEITVKKEAATFNFNTNLNKSTPLKGVQLECGSTSNWNFSQSQSFVQSGVDVKPPFTPKNKVVYTYNSTDTENQTPRNCYAETFKQYMTTYKNKPSQAQVRTQLALNSMHEGNASIQNLNQSVQQLNLASTERNNLIQQQNELLRQLVAIKENERMTVNKENIRKQ